MSGQTLVEGTRYGMLAQRRTFFLILAQGGSTHNLRVDSRVLNIETYLQKFQCIVRPCESTTWRNCLVRMDRLSCSRRALLSGQPPSTESQKLGRIADRRLLVLQGSPLCSAGGVSAETEGACISKLPGFYRKRESCLDLPKGQR